MPHYLGVRAVRKRGKIVHWVACAYGQDLGRAATPEKAVEIIRKMGAATSRNTLMISTVPRPRSVARYEGIHYRPRGKRSQGGWVVGKMHFFKSFSSALKWACRQKGVSPERLRKRVAPSELAARLRALTSTVPEMPYDLEDLVARGPHAQRMFEVAPVMVPIFIQAKMGPWRGLIQQAWRALARALSRVHCPLDEEKEAQLVHKVLVRVALDMSKDKILRAELKWWNKLNSGVQHHSGFLPMCLNLGILQTGGSMDLGSEETMYMVAIDNSSAVKKLKALSSAWRSLSTVLCVPRTCPRWRRCVLDSMKILEKKAAPRLNPNFGLYLPSWTLRSYLIMETRGRGIERMAFDGIGVRSLAQMNPDQKEWVSTFEQHVKTSAALMDLVGSRCPPELLSCQLCLLSRKALDTYDSEWIAASKEHIKVLAVIGKRLQHGVPMPIERVLQETAALQAEA